MQSCKYHMMKVFHCMSCPVQDLYVQSGPILLLSHNAISLVNISFLHSFEIEFCTCTHHFKYAYTIDHKLKTLYITSLNLSMLNLCNVIATTPIMYFIAAAVHEHFSSFPTSYCGMYQCPYSRCPNHSR